MAPQAIEAQRHIRRIQVRAAAAATAAPDSALLAAEEHAAAEVEGMVLDEDDMAEVRARYAGGALRRRPVWFVRAMIAWAAARAMPLPASIVGVDVRMC